MLLFLNLISGNLKKYVIHVNFCSFDRLYIKEKNKERYMNWLYELSNDKSLEKEIRLFYNTYGTSGIKEALKLYSNLQQEYICRTRKSVSKLRMDDIYYLEIEEHDISVFTSHGVYHKYGTLNQEMKLLSPYGFVRCSQSCIVSLRKIQKIGNNDILLVNHVKIHLSRRYAAKVLVAFLKTE